MPDDDQELRPETYALDSLIQATIRRARMAPGTQDAMLFMGNWHQAFPTQVVRDPVLEPVDKLVWMVVMLHARETGGRAAFPSYDTLASQTNIASTSTIARAIAKRPDVLLCDEPTGALDITTGIVVLDAIERVNRELGTATVLITHNAAIAGMADRVVRLADGLIVGIERNALKRNVHELQW